MKRIKTWLIRKKFVRINNILLKRTGDNMSQINYSRRTTEEQYKIYLAALESDSYFNAIEKNVTDPLSLVADGYLKNIWMQLSEKLNSVKGPKRTWKGWKKNFSDWKHETRKRYLRMIQDLSVLEAKVLYLTGSSNVTNLKNLNFEKLLSSEDVTKVNENGDFKTSNNGNEMEDMKGECLSNSEIKTEDVFETNCTIEMIHIQNMEMNISAPNYSQNANIINSREKAKIARAKKRESMRTRTLDLKLIHANKDRKNIKVYQNKKKLLESRLSKPTITEENKNTTQLKELSAPKVINGNLKLLCSQPIDQNPQKNIIIRETDKITNVHQIEPTQQNVKKIDLKILNISHNVPNIKCENDPDYSAINCDFSTENNLIFDIKKEEMSE